MSQKAATAMLAGLLVLGGLWGVLFALWTGNHWLLALVGGLSLAGLLQLLRKRRNLAFSGALALLVVGVDGVTYAFVPSVTFLVAAKAFPGHMVVEFRSDCPGSIRRSVPLKIEYVVPMSGYACSSTPLPEHLNAHFILYDPRSVGPQEPTASCWRQLLRDRYLWGRFNGLRAQGVDGTRYGRAAGDVARLRPARELQVPINRLTTGWTGPGNLPRKSRHF